MPSSAFVAARQAYLRSLKSRPQPVGPSKPLAATKKQLKHEPDTEQVTPDALKQDVRDIKLDVLLSDHRQQHNYDDSGSITDSLTDDSLADSDEDGAPISPGSISGGATVDNIEANKVKPVEQTNKQGEQVDMNDNSCQQDKIDAVSTSQTRVPQLTDTSNLSSAITPTYEFRHIKKRQASITKIQRFWRVTRMHSQSKELHKYTSNLEAKICSKLAIKVQAAWRGYMAWKKFNRFVCAVMTFQDLFRERRNAAAMEDVESLLIKSEYNLTYIVENEDVDTSQCNALYPVNNMDEFESCDMSQCSFDDAVHEVLMVSGKWMYERVFDPLEDFDVQIPAAVVALVEDDVEGKAVEEAEVEDQVDIQASSVTSSNDDIMSGDSSCRCGNATEEIAEEQSIIQASSLDKASACTDDSSYMRADVGANMSEEAGQASFYPVHDVPISTYQCEFKQLKQRAEAVLKIQCFWRETKSAIKVQAQWRRYTASSNFRIMVSAIQVQAQWRKYIATRNYRVLLSALKIHAHWRRYVARRDFIRVTSAIKIQALSRRFAPRRDFIRVTSAIKIQGMWRSFVTRRYFVNVVSAVRVQTQWRRYQATKQFDMLVNAVIVLQSIARAMSSRDLIPHKLAVKHQRLKAASTRIQTIYRGYSARCQYDLDEIIYQVIVLQSLVRRARAIELRAELEDSNYFLMISLVKKIQRAYRKHRQGSTITKRLLVQRRLNYGVYREEKQMSKENMDYVDDEDIFESKCCSVSRCGLDDVVHEMLMESGKWMYELIGDPVDVDTAENLITVMEISEEASGCLCWKPATDESKKED